MGLTNHGNQNISYNFYENLTGLDFNKRHIDIQPRGIYNGGYLAKVSDSEVTLSPFTVEVGDSSVQISSKSSANATLKSATLDSGGISPATPFLVFRWAYAAQQNNYVEVHAIVSVAAAQSNDIIIGKCVFSGVTLDSFDYTDRTFLNVQDVFLRVESTEITEMYVRVRAGRIQTSSQCVTIAEQKVGPFAVPSSPNSRIDLVYIDTDGTVKIAQGVAAPSPIVPSYDGKLVLAQVRLVNGDTNIASDRITDVRSFITRTSIGVQFRYSESWDFIISPVVCGVWTDIDLSSIVPANAKGVILHVVVSGTLANIWISFRKKRPGNSPTGNPAGWYTNSTIASIFSNPGLGSHEDLTVEVGSDRKIQYFSHADFAGKWNEFYIGVRAWFIQ